MTIKTRSEWEALAATISVDPRLFIDGEHVSSASDQRIEMINPADGSRHAEVEAAALEDLDRAVAAAQRAFDEGAWSKLHPRDRKRIMLALADLVDRHRDELALLISLDMGKVISDAQGEIDISLTVLRFFAESVDKVFGEVAPVGPGGLATITREPLGVVGAIVPWNYPLMMVMWKIAPALATGNTVVLKPAEQSPRVALRVAELAREAGFPAGVLNVLPGFGPVVGKAIGLHPGIAKVTFTGSTATGRLILQYAAESNMKRTSVELGGKSATILLSDTPDVSAAAAMLAEGIFGNTGQVCNASSRLLVHRAIRDEFLEELRKHTANWQAGHPLDPAAKMGPLVTSAQKQRVENYLGLASDEGGEVHSWAPADITAGSGNYVDPFVVTGLENRSRVAQEEIFGPVATVIDFEDDAEAIRLANDSDYGLAAGVWTSDVVKAITYTRELRAGSVYVNCWDYGDITLPFGGFKQSGIGRDKSLHALHGFTELKSTYINLS